MLAECAVISSKADERETRFFDRAGRCSGVIGAARLFPAGLTDRIPALVTLGGVPKKETDALGHTHSGDPPAWLNQEVVQDGRTHTQRWGGSCG